MVDLETLEDDDVQLVHKLIGLHLARTGSTVAQHTLDNWDSIHTNFVKVMPRDYKRVLLAEARARAESREPEFKELIGIQ